MQRWPRSLPECHRFYSAVILMFMFFSHPSCLFSFWKEIEFVCFGASRFEISACFIFLLKLKPDLKTCCVLLLLVVCSVFSQPFVCVQFSLVWRFLSSLFWLSFFGVRASVWNLIFFYREWENEGKIDWKFGKQKWSALRKCSPSNTFPCFVMLQSGNINLNCFKS